MIRFPKTFRPENRKKFDTYSDTLVLADLRKKIVEDVYNDQTSKHKAGTRIYQIKPEIVQKARDELHRMGWKTIISFGDTTLFLYHDDSDLPDTVLNSMNNVQLSSLDDINDENDDEN